MNILLLSEKEQCYLIFSNVEFIDAKVKGEMKFGLYKLFSFYIEIAYNSHYNKVINLIAF